MVKRRQGREREEEEEDVGPASRVPGADTAERSLSFARIVSDGAVRRITAKCGRCCATTYRHSYSDPCPVCGEEA